MAKKMTEIQLAQLREDLLRLYEVYHPKMTPREEGAISQVRDFIHDLMDQ
jgi:hypothetical protein